MATGELRLRVGVALLLGIAGACSGGPGGGGGGDGGGAVLSSGRAGASVHYYFYKGLGMLRCPGRIAGYATQDACDALGRSQTENGAVNQVGLTCDSDPAGCISGSELLVTATDRCPAAARAVRITYKANTVEARIVDRTPGNGGFDLGLDPYFDLGIYADYNIGVTMPQELSYDCLK
jgi:hypothetical protein